MSTNSFKLSGSKESLAALRQALLAEPRAAGLSISDPVEQPESATPAKVRVRQPWELAEAVWLVVVTFPIGIAAELAGKQLDDWLRAWLTTRADKAQVRVQEVSDPSAPSAGGATGA